MLLISTTTEVSDTAFWVLVGIVGSIWGGSLMAGVYHLSNQKLTGPQSLSAWSGAHFYPQYLKVAVGAQVVTVVLCGICLVMFFDSQRDVLLGDTRWWTAILDLSLVILLAVAFMHAPFSVDLFRLAGTTCAVLWFVRLAFGRLWQDSVVFEDLIVTYVVWWAIVTTAPSLFLLGRTSFPSLFRRGAEVPPVLLEAGFVIGPLALALWGFFRIDWTKI